MSKENNGRVGPLDRAFRLVLAAVLLGFALFCPFAKAQGPVVVWLSALFGVVFLGTALLGRCPVYRLLRKNT